MMCRNRKILFLSAALLVLSGLALSSAAPSLSLNWYKNNGYGFGNDIGGEWTITAQVSSDVTRVEFYIDDQLEQNSTVAPFKWNFNTADYDLGSHTIKAVAYNGDGQTASTQEVRNFVEYSTDIVFVIGGVVVAVVAVIFLILLYRARKKEDKKGKS